MEEDESPMEYDGTDVDGVPEDFEEDGGFENDIDISGEEFQPRGRGRAAAFR